MRRYLLALLSVVLNCLASAYGQVPAQIPSAPAGVKGGSDFRPKWITNPVFASGMKCDGVTDDSEALQAILASAVRPGLGNATVIMPPGICIIDPADRISINTGIWLQGAGRFSTTLKRRNSSRGSSILSLNSNGITLSDFAIDGNKGGQGIATPADSVAAEAPLSQITIQRMRFLNSTHSDIVSNVLGPGIYTMDWVIEDNDFENQGDPFTSCIAVAKCANLRLLQPLRLKISRNQSNNSEQFVLLASIPGGGSVDIGENTVTNLAGYGVALGGGVLGAAGAHIHHNFISTNSTDPDNLIDVAFWTDFSVEHNFLYHNSVSANGTGEPNACIADFPPADHGEVDSNSCYALPTIFSNVVGISMGGNDVSITNNFVQGCSTAGIVVAVGSQGPARGVRVIGNTSKNNSHQTSGAHGGIDIFLGSGAPFASAVADVIIRGNHTYDDQPAKTQGYGIAVGFFGVRTGITNLTIEDNDVAGNMTAGILNSADPPYSGWVIRNNLGFNPVGEITPPAFPASGTALTNTTGYDVNIYIISGFLPVGIAINGTTLTGVLVPGGSKVSGPIRLPANQNITLTYAPGGTPNWQWIAE